ncbi:uncharacterized protein Z520_07299 [Fonsecaea multimorphosa CBS 102226]|uniref:Fumarylacetoacetase-like C-terminal domain-containing protein n=1 Tax=Fonsecaea multimorphosa CBS 102226 TaxID=1442371 RepID=A0A0D2H5Q4_9EURO|nr:uncharacterized protein Z520_07299 [Fonsecaea multimorphosa CBS 102226]KIX97185.1 hypothetical protein Z520_07299 [Fonsecaea multimorphosa CBS 102226]
MPVQVPWSRLIRFIASDEQIYYGDVITDDPNFDVGVAAMNTAASPVRAKIVVGWPFSENCEVTERVETVKKLLGPFSRQDAPVIRCIGGNYAEHLDELNYKRPQHPIMFPKTPNAVAGYGDDVVIPKIAQDDQADYEIELAVIMGKDALNVTAEEAYDYVVGYTVSNDMSTRSWQLDPALAGAQPQMSFSKSFDGFLPLGPCIVSAESIKDPQSLSLLTRINGHVRQKSTTKNMIFSVPEIIQHCSQGTTLQAGSILTTGTPSGVGYRMDPPQYLQHGDRVEMTIGKIGTLVHGIVYA